MTSATDTAAVREMVGRLTRSIIGIDNRTPLEVFDIMCDRIQRALATFALTQRQGWRPIEEAPTCQENVAIVGFNAAFNPPYWIGYPYDMVRNALIQPWTGRWRIVTHWQPLPPPPDRNGEEG